MEKKISKQIFADIMGTSKRVIESWIKSGQVLSNLDNETGKEYITEESLKKFSELDFLLKDYTSLINEDILKCMLCYFRG